eukprot:COSAG03_NODE_8563_length_792_cov_1.044733_1_plen_152_part_01
MAAVIGKAAIVLVLLGTPLILEEWMPLPPILILVFITLNTMLEDHAGMTKDDLVSLYGSSPVKLNGKETLDLDDDDGVLLIARQQDDDGRVITSIENMTEENRTAQRIELTQWVQDHKLHLRTMKTSAANPDARQVSERQFVKVDAPAVLSK